MSGHRHAAVALHGLAAEDRRAILGELPAGDRAILDGYLAELDELGFDCSAVSDSLAPPLAGATTAAQRVARASAAHMLELLAGEPLQYGAAVLALGPWPWADELVALWDPASRHALRAPYLGAMAQAPALRECMLDELARRLGPERPPACAPRAGLLGRARQKVVAWIR